ncbi:hypothetical protein EDB84DRAFT_1441098 [Lactarius hengduanensis]|nr:hypothetical protein EDB84DRAFT_1441098 [Lactarius hengduanensis]
MSDVSHPSRSQSRAEAGSPPSTAAIATATAYGPTSAATPSIRQSVRWLRLLGQDSFACCHHAILRLVLQILREESMHKKKRSPSPLANYMDRIPLSQRVVRGASEDYERASRVAETISVESQSTEVPPAGNPTPAEALEMPDTMDIDDTGGSTHHLFGPLEVDTPKRKHAMGISLPVFPMPEDLGSVESRMERCKLRIADVWDDLREMRGRVQVVNDMLLKALHDMEALVKYLE